MIWKLELVLTLAFGFIAGYRVAMDSMDRLLDREKEFTNYWHEEFQKLLGRYHEPK